MEKTIVQKLSLHKYTDIAILNQPEGSHYFDELEKADTSLAAAGYDTIFAFVLDLNAMKELTFDVIERGLLNKNGYLFMAYPKKGNKKYSTYVHRDEIMPAIGCDEEGYIGTSSVKFARMVGMDDVFTVVGLKEDAKSKGKSGTSTKASQRVDDYIELIADVENDLKDEPELLALYGKLTPGYRKDWARYIYSAKQEETRENRRVEMKQILQAGYKSKELYRKDHP
ncbi:YdeI/OmpD-associated family protein [Paenibacillus sp. GXUN7292]|uniref:YdeI/OmpD-associated family protein n=1 Tax=Paenibacillus sp. GXUN7292 TaxID=3422499 RepID=UPI003D7C87CF